MRATWRALAAALAVLLLPTCGGGDDAARDDDVASDVAPAVIEESGPTLVEFGDAVVTELGVDSAFAAVLYALDAGYSLEQLVPAAFSGDLDVAGGIAGVEPAGPPHGLITPPPEPMGFAYSPRPSGASPDDTAGATYSPDEVQDTIKGNLVALMTINLLGAPLGVGGEITYADVFADSTPPADVGDASRDEATAMIGVLVGLIDLGYSYDQALEGWLFGEVEMAIGVDPTGETFTGVSLDDRPVAVCLTLRGSDGQVVQPAKDAPAALFGSATCASAIRNRSISYDGLDELRVDGSGAGSPDTTAAATTSAPGDVDVTVFDGIYTADAIERDLGAIVEVLETTVDIAVSDGVVDGAVIQTSIVVQETRFETESYTKTERATQTVLLLGRVEPTGSVIGEGTTAASYELLACEPEEPCRGVGPTQSVGEVGVSFSGTIEGDTMSVDVVNSVSGATFSFTASR